MLTVLFDSFSNLIVYNQRLSYALSPLQVAPSIPPLPTPHPSEFEISYCNVRV